LHFGKCAIDCVPKPSAIGQACRKYPQDSTGPEMYICQMDCSVQTPRARHLKALGEATFLSFFVVVPIVSGAAIYTFWRSKTLLVFTWYRWAGVEAPVMSLRKNLAGFRHLLPGVFLYSVPDALWVYSFTTLLEYVWSEQPICWELRTWTLLPLVLGVSGEFGQLLHLVPGTFDWADVIAYLAAWFAAQISVATFLKLARKQPVIGLRPNENPA